ncbi:MAG TPA: hypothetical protein VGE43_14425 [Acidimicrobiales bacterium]
MRRQEGPPRAVVELVNGDDAVQIGALHSVTCDAELVDHLLKFDVAARRLGWQLHLRDVDPALHELLDLLGLSDRAT